MVRQEFLHSVNINAPRHYARLWKAKDKHGMISALKKPSITEETKDKKEIFYKAKSKYVSINIRIFPWNMSFNNVLEMTSCICLQMRSYAAHFCTAPSPGSLVLGSNQAAWLRVPLVCLASPLHCGHFVSSQQQHVYPLPVCSYFSPSLIPLIA